MADRDVASYLAELKVLTGRAQASFDTQIYSWFNDLFEDVETDPEKLWVLDKTVQFDVGVSDIGPNGLVIAVPQDFVHAYVLHVVDTTTNNYTEILPIASRDAKSKYGPNDTGAPERVSDEGKSLRFWPPVPTATSTVEMEYKAGLTRVSATGDTNDLMENYHALLMAGLQWRAWQYLRMFDVAQVYKTEWNEKWANLRAANVARILSGEIQLSPRTDVFGSTSDERDGNKLVWGGGN